MNIIIIMAAEVEPVGLEANFKGTGQIEEWC